MGDSAFCDMPTLSCYPLKITIPGEDTANYGIKHNINRVVNIQLGGHSIPVFSTQRTFNMYGGRGGASNVKSAVYGVAGAVDENNPNGVVYCGGASSPMSGNGFVTEHCEISRCVFHYINMQHGVAFFERQNNLINFSLSSAEKLGAFRTRWGTFWTLKFIIPKGTLAYTSSQFVYWKNGTERILAGSVGTLNPFPETGGAIATGGLGSPDVYQSGLAAAANVNTANIQLILCIPQPPGEATATDHDPEILAKGFYDYNLLGESLWEADGGKDFFYPAWCRALIPDPYWAYEAQARFQHSFNNASFPSTGVTPELAWELAPQCSYAVHPVHGEMWHWTFTDGDGVGHSFCELNGEPIKDLLAETVKPHTLEEGISYTPISLY